LTQKLISIVSDIQDLRKNLDRHRLFISIKERCSFSRTIYCPYFTKTQKARLPKSSGDNCSGENVKTSEPWNVSSILVDRPCLGRGFQTVLLISTLFFFGMASPVSGAPATVEAPSASQSQSPAITPAAKSRAMNVFMDGVDALEVKNYEKAAERFEKAVALEPQNPDYQYYLGIAYVRLKKEHAALDIFELLTDRAPKLFFKAYFDIAAIHNGRKAYKKAIDTLRIAEKINPGSGRVLLELGYAYKDSGKYSQAIACFKRAGELDSQLNQISVYMAGATYREAEKFDQAALMFKKVLALDSKNPLAESARQTLAHLEKAAWDRKPWYLVTSFLWGYDDNVARDPLNAVAGGPVNGGTGKGDQFQTFFLKGGYKLLNRKGLEAGLGYSVFSLGYRDWTDSNVLSHSPHVYVQANCKPVFFRFQYDLSHFYSGGKKQDINPPVYLTFATNSHARLLMHSFMSTISVQEPYDLRTDINLIYQIKGYLDGLTRDSYLYGADITQSYKIPGTKIFPRIGYRSAYEQSDDNPSTYYYHELIAGISSAIYGGIWGDISFSYMRTHYPDFSTSDDRTDSTYTAAFSLRRNFLKRLLLSFSFRYMKNDSDYVLNGDDLYTFKKNVYMLEITYTF